MSGGGFAGALTARDEYPGRDAEVEALVEVLRQDPVRRIWLDESDAAGLARAVLAAGYTRRPAAPGLTDDERDELTNVGCPRHRPGFENFICRPCADAEIAVVERILARRPAPAGVPVEALRELDHLDLRNAAHAVRHVATNGKRRDGTRRALLAVADWLDSATTDGGES